MKFILLLLLFVQLNATITKNEIYLTNNTPSKITIDGIIDSIEWQSSTIINQFYEQSPGENIPSKFPMDVFITQDSLNLYFGFKIIDNSDEFRANFVRRDNIFDDDLVGVVLDPFNEEQVGIEISANPFGIQGDIQIIGKKKNIGFDINFQSKGNLTETGYEVEIGIPFSSIRFPDSNEPIWRINIFRHSPRSDAKYEISWLKNERNNPCKICQYGYLKGLKLPKVNKNNLEILPSFTGNLSRNSNLESNQKNWEKFLYKPSLGIKYSIGNSGIAEITINPDFSQIESDQNRINLNSQFATIYPEKRPFFNEGGYLFRVGGHFWKPKPRIIHSRTINEPEYAVKYIKKNNDTEFGFITAMDKNSIVFIPYKDGSMSINPGRSRSDILRYKKPLGKGSNIGGVINNRKYKGGNNIITGIDGNIYLSENTNFEYQYHISQTNEPHIKFEEYGSTFGSFNEYTIDWDGEEFSGHNLFFNLGMENRNWGYNLIYSQTDPLFRADNGYVKRSDDRGFLGNIFFQHYPKNRFINEFRYVIAAGHSFDYQMNKKDNFIFTNFSGNFIGQTNLDLTFIPMNFWSDGNSIKNVYESSLNISSYYFDWLQILIGISYNNSIIWWEDPIITNKMIENSFDLSFSPNSKTSFGISSNYQNYIDLLNGQLTRVNFSYQFNSSTSYRFIIEHNEFVSPNISMQNLFNYQPTPFTVFYLGNSSVADYSKGKFKIDSHYIFIKLQYLFKK